MIYAFDVDGTLTPSRQRIPDEFAEWFSEWIDQRHQAGDQIMLITGSDYPKTLEQLGEEILGKTDWICNSAANQVRHQGVIVHDFELPTPPELLDFLESFLEQSEYPERTGNHIEHRGSMINFSVVGRNAQGEQRTRYAEWDQKTQERRHLAQQLNEQFADQSIHATVGGETGIDITAEGLDKRQALRWIDDHVIFLGDRCEPGGNDYAIAQALETDHRFEHQVIPVSDWQDTWNHLKRLTP